VPPKHKKSSAAKSGTKKGERSWIKHPMTLAITPVVIGAILAALFTFIQNRPVQPSPNIELDGIVMQPAKVYPDPVKLTFEIRNTGSQLAIIRGVGLRFLQFASLPVCLSQGDLSVTGNYSADVPSNPIIGTTIDVPTSQQVGPDAADEFQVSLRGNPLPNSETVGVYRVEAGLLYDNEAAPIDASDLFFSLPFEPNNSQYVWTRAEQSTHGNSMWYMGNVLPEISQCMINNSKRLDPLLNLPGQRSTSLTSLQSQMVFCCKLGSPPVEAFRCLGGKPSMRPSSLTIDCDGDEELQQLSWSSWSFSSAKGIGTLRIGRCQQGCNTVATSRAYPVSIQFSDPAAYTMRGYDNMFVWEQAVITFTGTPPAGMNKTTTYSTFAPNP
jgi:hypothetical protein